MTYTKITPAWSWNAMRVATMMDAGEGTTSAAHWISWSYYEWDKRGDGRQPAFHNQWMYRQ